MIKSYLFLVGFCLVLASLFEAAIFFKAQNSKITIIHEEVEIEFIEDITTMNEYEYSTLELTASK